MRELQWEDRLTVGIPSIDNQHRQLFDRVNRLFVAASERAPKEEMENLFIALVSATLEHFRHEESLLEKNHYPRLDEHKVEHEKLVGEIKELLFKYHIGVMSLGPDLFSFLERWLVRHIETSDLAYAPLLTGKDG